MANFGTFEIDLDELAEQASRAAWSRGEAYAKDGRIELITASPSRVTARAHGTETYETSFHRQDGELTTYCSCPAFEQYEGPCKHLVALAITLRSPAGRRRQSKAAERDALLRRYLQEQPPERLVQLLLEATEEQPSLRQRLEFEAETAGADPAEAAAILKKAITAATRTQGYVDYRRMPNWAARVDQLIEQLRDSLGKGQASAVLDLVPYLVERLEKALDDCDDDGHFEQLFYKIRALVISAAEAAKPDGETLAALLIGLENDSEFLDWSDLADDVRPLLGEAGLKRYQNTIESEWKALKTLRPGDAEDRFEDSHRLRVTQRRLALAEAAGDVDAQIETLSKTLISPFDYTQVARLCLEHGRTNQALAVVEEALWIFERKPSDELAQTAASIFGAVGQHDRALRLLWKRFEEGASLQTYRDITRAAEPAGRQAEYERRALAWLHEQCAYEKADANRRTSWTWQSSLADTLVEIHLEEDRLDQAWAATAEGSILPRTLERLARASETTRPADAASVYQSLTEGAIDARQRSGYERACTLIPKVQALRLRAGQADRFDAWLEELRRTHKAKRSFIALLDQTALR